jgi:Cytochrome P450
MELLTIITICILPVTLLGYCFYRRRLARARLPPGPLCLPLLGSLPFTDLNDVVGTFRRWAEKYGPLFSCEMGPYTTVILNDPTLIKEAFSKDVFVPRPKFWGVIQRSRIYNNTNGMDCPDTKQVLMLRKLCLYWI